MPLLIQYRLHSGTTTNLCCRSVLRHPAPWPWNCYFNITSAIHLSFLTYSEVHKQRIILKSSCLPSSYEFSELIVLLHWLQYYLAVVQNVCCPWPCREPEVNPWSDGVRVSQDAWRACLPDITSVNPECLLTACLSGQFVVSIFFFFPFSSLHELTWDVACLHKNYQTDTIR